MKIFVRIALVVGIFALTGVIGYAAWYSYDRHEKILHNVGCDRLGKPDVDDADDIYVQIPCAYEIVPPTLWKKFTGRIPGARAIQPVSGCDQSATTTDCGEITRIAGAVPISAISPLEQQAMFYSDVYETAHLLDRQEIDDFLTVNNALVFVSSETCGVGVRTRGIFIDGTDIVARIAMLATEAGAKSHWGAGVFCEALQRKRGGVIEARDPIIFTGSDVGLRGPAYHILIATHQFVVAPEENRIYPASAYDGSRGEPIGTLWQEHTQAEIGISFSCPMLGQAGSGPGETGRGFYFSCNTSNGFINGGAITVDYSVPKGGTMYPREGYVERDGSYYLLRRGVPAETPFVPDEIWKTADGRDVLVKFAKREGYDFHADYPEPAIMGVVNIERGGFSGIGFGWHTDVFRFATEDDIAYVRRFISTLRVR